MTDDGRGGSKCRLDCIYKFLTNLAQLRVRPFSKYVFFVTSGLMAHFIKISLLFFNAVITFFHCLEQGN